MIRDRLLEIYRLLFERFGPQRWWSGRTPFETTVGVILSQNASQANIDKALANLKAAGALDPTVLHAMAPPELEKLIRPAGNTRVKLKRLTNFARWLFENYEGSLERLSPIDTRRLREELLGISGIGPETTDSILLYGLKRPIFVVDTYTARVAVRHFLIEPELTYDGLQELFQSNLEPDVPFFNEFHALIVRVGKDHCRPKALCPSCPLNALPHDPNAGLGE
jgi:endonuclease III related protein